VIEGGGNDILDTTTGAPQSLAYQIAVAIVKSEQMLRQAGAKHFVILNLFNVGILAAAADSTAFAASASAATNKYVNQLLVPETELPCIHILRIDFCSLVNAVGADPMHFGFSDITDPCLTTALCADRSYPLLGRPQSNRIWARVLCGDTSRT
jgi:phospholipase/lecithinase/hemolysin